MPDAPVCKVCGKFFCSGVHWEKGGGGQTSKDPPAKPAPSDKGDDGGKKK